MFKLRHAMLCKKPSLPGLYMWEEIMAKLISSPFMLSWIESTVNWLKTRNLLRNAAPLYRIKLVTNQKYTERPLNTRTCLIVHIFILKNFHYISFVLYRVSCVRNFLAYKLFGSQLLMFFYRTWVPFKSIKNRKRSAVNYKILYFLVSTRWLFYFQFGILIMKGVKSCSGLSGFSLRSHHIATKKNQLDRR